MGHLSMNSSVDLQCHGNRRQVFWCVRPDLTRLIIRDRPTKTTCVGLFLGCGIERSLMKGSECGMGLVIFLQLLEKCIMSQHFIKL